MCLRVWINTQDASIFMVLLLLLLMLLMLFILRTNWCYYSIEFCSVNRNNPKHTHFHVMFWMSTMTHNGAMQAIRLKHHQMCQNKTTRPTSINKYDRMRNHQKMLGFHFPYLEIVACELCGLFWPVSFSLSKCFSDLLVMRL